MYNRILQTQIEYWLNSDMVLILYGARQVGKTTLAKKIAYKYDKDYFYVDCEDFTYQSVLNSGSIEQIKTFVGSKKTIVFDEAQKVQHIGIALKLIHDHFPEIKVIATGSSSFDLANKISEPLTGRNIKFHLYSLSLKELAQQENVFNIGSKLLNILRFGTYPKIVGLSDDDSVNVLKALSTDYVYRDIKELIEIRKPQQFKDLLRTLAFLIGQTVTYNDIAKKIGSDRETVERYIDILEKAFIIKILRPLHRSHIREVLHPFKLYFYDLGIRNALIGNYTPITSRDSREVGVLWENLCVIERFKLNEYGNPEDDKLKLGLHKNYYFWRTKEASPKEYDLIEELDSKFQVFEMKWSSNKENSVKRYNVFFETYPNSELNVIHNENWWKWLI